MVVCFGVTLSMAGVKPVNTTLFGVAIKGYDPVAYFTESKPVEGNKEFEFIWQDAKWRFASEANRVAFKSAPQKYAPQYGGYCAWAVSQGYTAGIDPTAWRIVDGKLYLNYSADVQKKWQADIPGLIKKADANWPKIKE
ncbi:MAG: hypothetical protein RIQ79_1847 [Verrucomicrobiota bacterium]